ncbi:centromere protein C isoform X2 [Zootoca vivipara]|uniref:centromere protein C isoform X2 n=1 Tax=Zootoca vivipara TaxID=8524 RepID=UPI00159202A6|nr:centromere protein C isoform X2 [Zootoca vivipara]
MHSLNHLKDNYRARYCNQQGQNKVPEIKQGENVLKYIQDCFKTGAEENAVCSPSTSCCSSTCSDVSQTLSQRRKEEQIEPEPNKINYVQNVFNTNISLPSPEENDRISDAATLKGAETSSSEHADSTDEDVSVMFALPVFLNEDEEMRPGWHEEAPDKDLQSSTDARESEEHHARKETKELSTCFATSSCQKKIPASVASLDTMTRSSKERNTASIEPEDECEFVIEESYGFSSTSWISTPQSNKKRQKVDLISPSSEGGKRAKQQSVRRQDKRTPKKLVTPTPIKQSKRKLINSAERTVKGMQTVSRTNERIAVEGCRSPLTVNTTQQVRKRTPSKGKPSVGICNEDCQVSASGSHAGDVLFSQEQDHAFSLQPQAIVSPAQRSCQRKRSVKQSCSKVKPLVASRDEGYQDSASPVEVRPERIPSSGHNVLKAPSPAISTGEQLSCGKKPRKQTHSKRKPSVEIHEDDRQECTPAAASPKGRRKSIDAEDPAPVRGGKLSKHKQSPKPTARKSSRSKSAKRRKPKKRPSRKDLETPMSTAQRPRRKNKVLVSSDNSESEHGGEEQRSEKGEATGESKRVPVSEQISENKSAEGGRISESRKTLPREVRPTSLASAEESGIAFCQEDYPERGLVSKNKTSSKHQIAVNREDSTSDESEDLEEEQCPTYSSALKRKMILPSNTPNIRRTKRIRLKPLEYWRGERVKYKMRPSGGFVVNGVISPEQREPRKLKPKRTTPVLEFEVPSDSTVSLKSLSEQAVVFDKDANKEVLLDCVSSSNSHLLYINDDTVSIYKQLNTPLFSAGKLILKPLKEKGFQYSHTETLVFHISCGTLLLTLYDQCYRLTAGDYFYIPPGNVYNIRNLLNKECVVFFTQIKGSRSENS